MSTECAHLEALGWTVITVWECELRSKEAAKEKIDGLAEEIRAVGERRMMAEKLRRSENAAARKERVRMLERQKALEMEIRRIYPIPNKIKTASIEE